MPHIELVIKIPEETYNNFIHNEYSRADVIAMHAAIINATPYETVTEFADRCRECGAKYGKLLKQEPVLDKIIAEINKPVIRDEYSQRQNDYCDGYEFVCSRIKKIIGDAESEDK